jgi:hypothetical protein
MHAIINGETSDRPGRLAGVYGQILTTGTNPQIKLPSEVTIPAAAVTTDNNEAFINIMPKNPQAIDNKTYLLDSESDYEIKYRKLDGIEDIKNGPNIIGLQHPVRDLNDAFLAAFANAVYNATPNQDDDDKNRLRAIRTIIEHANGENITANNVDEVSAASAFIFSRRMYYGVDGDEGFVSGGTPINVPAPMNLAQAKQFVQNLKTRTEGHRNNGLRRATFF